MNQQLMFGIAAMMVSAAVGAHESAAADSPRDAVSGKSRAEVRAEVEVWRQAGLDRYDMEGVDFTSRNYQQQLAEYQRLRSGPEYEAALRRNENRNRSHAAAKAGDAQGRTN